MEDRSMVRSFDDLQHLSYNTHQEANLGPRWPQRSASVMSVVSRSFQGAHAFVYLFACMACVLTRACALVSWLTIASLASRFVLNWHPFAYFTACASLQTAAGFSETGVSPLPRQAQNLMSAKPKASQLKRPRSLQAPSRELQPPSQDYGAMDDEQHNNEHDDWVDEWRDLSYPSKMPCSRELHGSQRGQTLDNMTFSTTQKVLASPPTQPRAVREDVADRIEDGGGLTLFGRAHNVSSSCDTRRTGISAIALPSHVLGVSRNQGGSLESRGNPSLVAASASQARPPTALFDSLFAGF